MRLYPFLLAVVLLLAAPVAVAHGGGVGPAVETRLEMPDWVVWVTGAGVVALSFAVVGAFLSRAPSEPTVLPAPRALPVERPVPRGAALALPYVGLAVVALVGVNAFLPESESLLPEAVVWLVVWAGLPIVAYSVGNVWELVSPFRALAPAADAVRGGRSPRGYPAHLGAWPAVAFLLALIGLEVSVGSGREAGFLARLVLVYVAFTFLGMAAFGSEVWLSHAEGLTRAFRWWSAFSPSRLKRSSSGVHGPRMAGVSDVAFTVALLYGVNFDGFLATRAGAGSLSAFAPLGAGPAHVLVLVIGYSLFLGVFWWCARLVRQASESLEDTSELAVRFAASLIPIAIAYHLAHNLFYVWEYLPRIVRAFADPFGIGWAGGLGIPASFALPAGLLGLLGALQIVLIVTGHVAAVVVAHRLAFDSFPSRVQAIRSELPLTAVMVFYTLVGLWIVSRGHHGVVGV